MHSDVSIYIAFSGEFFIRRLKHPHTERSDTADPEHALLPPAAEPEVDERPKSADDSHDPHHYELVIDNDSGTYRPNAKLLPELKHFFATRLPGLRVATLDCQADEEKMGKLKNEQREKKKKTREGQMTYMQNNSSDSSLSSSDEEQLDGEANEGSGGGVKGSLKKKVDSVRQPQKKFMEFVAQGDEPTGERK